MAPMRVCVRSRPNCRRFVRGNLGVKQDSGVSNPACRGGVKEGHIHEGSD